VLTGPVNLVADPNLQGQEVSLLVASAALRVTPVTSGSSASTTTVPTVPATTTTTTIPPNVYTNDQTEPWNPYPCTPGTTQASPSRASTPKKPKQQR
jgi:hypothetical protein